MHKFILFNSDNSRAYLLWHTSLGANSGSFFFFDGIVRFASSPTFQQLVVLLRNQPYLCSTMLEKWGYCVVPICSQKRKNVQNKICYHTIILSCTYTIIRDSKRKMIQIEALRANSKYFRATSLVPALKCQWQLCLNEQSKHGFHLDPVDPNEDI